MAFVALDKNKINTASLAVAHSDDGNFDFIDLQQDARTVATLPAMEADIATTRPFLCAR